MPFYPKRKTSDFIPAPKGLHYCVCVDVVDLGIVKTSWQGQDSLKDMLRVVWQTEDRMSSGPKAGQPYLINKRYTNSTHKKAGIRLAVEAWAGKQFTDEQFAAFDLERLIGKCCQIQITHNVSDGDTYANIMAIVPPPKGRPPLRIEGYTRVKDRPGYTPPPTQHEPEPAPYDETQPENADDGWATTDAEGSQVREYEDEVPF